MERKGREPQAPSPADEQLSASSLKCSPWVRKRIRDLRLRGRLVKGWTPPTYPDSFFAGRYQR
jgi:hypothetical protein